MLLLGLLSPRVQPRNRVNQSIGTEAAPFPTPDPHLCSVPTPPLVFVQPHSKLVLGTDLPNKKCSIIKPDKKIYIFLIVNGRNAIIYTPSLHQWLLMRIVLVYSKLLQESRDVSDEECSRERHTHTKSPNDNFSPTPTNALRQTAHAGLNEASSSKAICRITCWCWRTTSKEFKCYGILLFFKQAAV